MEFQAFDAAYIDGLCAGDPQIEAHFVAYFGGLLRLKLRSRLQSPHAIEDVRQETFARVLTTLRRDGTLRQPDRLGAFVNTVCNNVLLEHYRSATRVRPLEDQAPHTLVANGRSVFDEVLSGQVKDHVSNILQRMPSRDRELLKAVFLDEKERDEVCREFGVDSGYLRVLLFRAKQSFKTEYLRQMGTGISTRNQ